VPGYGYVKEMYTVGLRELKNRLTEYVRLAASGERVLVTDRNRVVAELTAPQTDAAEVADAALAELVRRGLATPPLARLQGPPARLGSKKLAEIMADLDADRADR
jgi:prevent-host-death family protein